MAPPGGGGGGREAVNGKGSRRVLLLTASFCLFRSGRRVGSFPDEAFHQELLKSVSVPTLYIEFVHHLLVFVQEVEARRCAPFIPIFEIFEPILFVTFNVSCRRM